MAHLKECKLVFDSVQTQEISIFAILVALELRVAQVIWSSSIYHFIHSKFEATSIVSQMS